MGAPIEFYFDFASPYGYFASLGIDALGAKHGRGVTWRPVLLGAVFKVTGMRPVLEQPLRGEYLRHDVGRIARLLGCPYRFPDSTPVNPLAASRAYWWRFAEDPDSAKDLARALFHAHWGEGRDIAAADTVVEVAASLGLDPALVAAGMQDQTAKDRLRAETDQAVARGVFGSPFMLVDGEPFWGWDRLDMLDRWLATGGW